MQKRFQRLRSKLSKKINEPIPLAAVKKLRNLIDYKIESWHKNAERSPRRLTKNTFTLCTKNNRFWDLKIRSAAVDSVMRLSTTDASDRIWRNRQPWGGERLPRFMAASERKKKMVALVGLSECKTANSRDRIMVI